MRLSAMMGLLVGLLACGGEDAPVGLLGEACTVSNECAEPMACLMVSSGAGRTVSMCSRTCTGDNDTSCQAIAEGALCRDRHCTYTCSLGGNCPNGGTCAVALSSSRARCVP